MADKDKPFDPENADANKPASVEPVQSVGPEKQKQQVQTFDPKAKPKKPKGEG